jgi:hypothetical protein
MCWVVEDPVCRKDMQSRFFDLVQSADVSCLDILCKACPCMPPVSIAVTWQTVLPRRLHDCQTRLHYTMTVSVIVLNIHYKRHLALIVFSG